MALLGVLISFSFLWCAATAAPGAVAVPDDAIFGPESTVAPAASTSPTHLRLRRNTRHTSIRQFAADIPAIAAVGLPCRKPPMWPGSVTLANGGTYTIKTDPNNKVVRASIIHKPIYDVNIKMINWMIDNMDLIVPHPTRPTEFYQVFVLAHPIDNVFLRFTHPQGAKSVVYNATDVTRGSVRQCGAFFAAGCTAKRGRQGSFDISCREPPEKRIAPTCNTPAATIANMSSLNTTLMYSPYNNASGHVMYGYEGGMQGGLPVSTVTFRWQNLRHGGVQIRQDLVFGFDIPVDSDAKILESARWINTYGLSRYFARATGGDSELAAAQAVLREMQQFRALPQWLPAVYAAATRRP